MPLTRINAEGVRPVLHDTPRPVMTELDRIGSTPGPVIVMIHGFKYSPGHPRHCPHRQIMALAPESGPSCPPSWPRQLGFGTGHAGEGLAIAFGWSARGALRRAQENALIAGQALAEVLDHLHRRNPKRPIHIIAHSMGTEVALEALHHLPAGALNRIVSMTGATFQSRAIAALNTHAGQTAELINITSRENDAFDFMFEWMTGARKTGDRAISNGLESFNAVTLQLDCPDTLDHLDRLGAPVAGPQRRICHWSSYTRPGILRFYNRLLRQPETLPLHTLRRGLPQTPAARWSRLVARPALRLPLPFIQKAS